MPPPQSRASRTSTRVHAGRSRSRTCRRKSARPAVKGPQRDPGPRPALQHVRRLPAGPPPDLEGDRPQLLLEAREQQSGCIGDLAGSVDHPACGEDLICSFIVENPRAAAPRLRAGSTKCVPPFEKDDPCTGTECGEGLVCREFTCQSSLAGPALAAASPSIAARDSIVTLRSESAASGKPMARPATMR